MPQKKSLTEITRPKRLDEVVGNNHIKQIIKYDIEGCKLLNRPLGSYIIVGPAGTSKSTFAGIIADMTGGTIYKHLGTEFRSDTDITDLASLAKDGDVVYVEEAQSIGKKAQVVLLEWIENFKVLGTSAEEAPKVSFIFPTTNSGKLSKPLRERCKTLYTTFYSIEDLEQILFNAGQKVGIDLSTDPAALRLLAQSSRGIPRIAVQQRLDALLKVMAVDNQPFNMELVQRVLEIHGIHPLGLESGDIKYCEILYQKMLENPNRGVSIGTMSKSSGFDFDVIEVIEQYLLQIGVISISTSGRQLTELGYKLLNKEPVKNAQQVIAAKPQIDVAKLEGLLQDPEIRSGGMKAVAPILGLKYPQDISKIKTALYQCGYTVKKKAGIISL